MLWSSGLGQVLGSYVANQMFAIWSNICLVQWLGWVFATQERKKERKALRTELNGVRSISFISTVVKSPDEACNIYKEFCADLTSFRYLDGSVSNALLLWCKSSVFESHSISGKLSKLCCTFLLFLLLQNYRTCVVKIESIFKTIRFSKWCWCIDKARTTGLSFQNRALWQ